LPYEADVEEAGGVTTACFTLLVLQKGALPPAEDAFADAAAAAGPDALTGTSDVNGAKFAIAGLVACRI